MQILCPFKEPCVDDQASLGNFSSEDPDALLFKGVHYKKQVWDGDLDTFLACLGRCVSTISQADADLCAAANAAQCQAAQQYLNVATTCYKTCPNGVVNSYTAPAGLWVANSQAQANALAYAFACQAVSNICLGVPPPALPPAMPHQVGNTPQSCTVACGTSGSFTYTVGAGQVWGFNITDANLQAMNMACTAADASKFCISSLPSNFCRDQVGAATATLTGSPAQPVFWQVSGSLPTGMSLASNNLTATLSGVPTVSGSFSFALIASDVNGNFAVRYFTMSVMGFATSDVLPDGTVGTPYSETITMDAGGYTAPLNFALEAGNSLPPGLTLNALTGEISGTPTTDGNYAFSIVVTDSS